jgi:hypothetical protein
LTGSRLLAFAEADATIRRLVEAAAKTDQAAGHQVSRDGPATAVLAQADLLISDVSSLAIDFLVTGRPLTITVPPDPAARLAPTRLLELTPRLGADELADLTGFLAGLLEVDGAGQAQRAALAEYYLGDTRPGAATKAFVDACGRMIALAESNLAKYGLASVSSAGPVGSASAAASTGSASSTGPTSPPGLTGSASPPCPISPASAAGPVSPPGPAGLADLGGEP